MTAPEHAMQRRCDRKFVAVRIDRAHCGRTASLAIEGPARATPRYALRNDIRTGGGLMRRLRRIMFLGVMALVFSGCLNPAPPDGAESEIDEVQNATSLDETAATGPAQIAAGAA